MALFCQNFLELKAPFEELRMDLKESEEMDLAPVQASMATCFVWFPKIRANGLSVIRSIPIPLAG
jgi:hypothetical protein